VSNIFQRTEMLIGKKALDIITAARVAVFGIGGVGGYTAEMLARMGVGHITLIDGDVVEESNINRQIIATLDTVGRSKTEVMKERILSINPDACVTAKNIFFLPENSYEIDFSDFNYIADAVDTVSAKIEIAVRAEKAGVPVISSMGTANKIDASMFTVSDIYDTEVCPLARVMRRELKKRGIQSLKVVYSKEAPKRSGHSPEIPAALSFVPPVAGCIMAGEIIKDITGIR
jgi:tRNA A37 threonylcarbamoyladenosine dehydratase